jgi:peroxiredoxin
MIAFTSFFIGWIFWVQEIQYALPTPVPAHFVDVKIGDAIDLDGDLKVTRGTITLLHFFNAKCPCSRFNMQEFESMAHRYKDSVQFYVVLQSDEDGAVAHFKDKYELDLPVILDKDGVISDKCGIYSTPQAVLLDKKSVVYFKGNYNASRYCTRRETKFVEMAIDSLIRNKPLPLFVQNMLTEPYGCTLPSDDDNQKERTVFNLF